MINLSAVSNEVFQLLRSFDYTVMMYDDDGMEVYEPDEARRFFAKPENLLVSVVEDNDDSRINLYLSGTTDAESVLGLITSLRTAANKYNMIFKDQQWDRDLTVKDFSTSRSVRETVEHMDLTEGMYGTSRSSYLKLENARMIVRHSAKIDENIAGSRCRRIENIFVENASGERFLFPTKQLAPARAMTQHFNHGGSFADQIGQQITQMATDYSALGQASSFIGMNMPVMAEGAGEVRQKCRETRAGMRKCFERLYRESTYDEEAEKLNESASNPVLAEDATIEKLRETLFVEGKEISEEVLNTIARCVESAQPVLGEDDMGDMQDLARGKEDGRSTIKDETGPTVSVMGHEVNKEVWDRLKAGNLELRVNPESLMGSGPNFADRQAELGYKLGIVASVTMSGSLFKLLSYASEELMSRENPALNRKLITLADGVLKLAKVAQTTNEGLGFRGSRVIREFEEWFDGMGSDNVLGVAPAPAPVPAVADAPVAPPITPAIDAEPSGLSADLSTGLSGDIENESMAADIAQGYTEGAGWSLDFPEQEAAEAACGGEDAVNRQIAGAVLGGSRNGSVHSDPENGPRKSFEWSIGSGVAEIAPAVAPVASVVPTSPMPVTPAPESLPAVVDPMSDDTIDVADTMGDDLGADDFGSDDFTSPAMEDDMAFESELTREDILLPNDEGDDLKREVGIRPDGDRRAPDLRDGDQRRPGLQSGGNRRDPDLNDDDDEGSELTLERLRKLSGIKISD